MGFSPIWDLRRGDYDDNRSSPHGGGLRSLILSTALEFNYLKAPLSFLILIVGPAIFVGSAPSVVATYGQFVFHTATLARSQLVVALVLVVILVGIALWLGRPLGAAAFLHLRQLNYTLVFPIFVSCREVLRVCIEGFMGASMTPEQLMNARKGGSIIAAMLFAVGGLTLATSVEFTLGFKTVPLDRVSLRTAILAVIGNSAVIIGVSTFFESLYWLWRELSISNPVLDWAPNSAQSSGLMLRVAHLSDLHLVGERYGYRMETGIHGPRGNRSFREALRKLAAIHAQSPLDRVLVTGDITDAGIRAEWAEFLDLLRGHEELRERLLFVPGNHDLNIVDRTNPGRLDLPWSAAPALRKLRCLLALDAVQGDRVHIVDRVSGDLGPSLREYLTDPGRVNMLRALAEKGTLRGRREVAKAWDTIFPLVEPAPQDDEYGLILLDSNARSHFSLTNAIGFVSPSQLKALRAVLGSSQHRAWIILLHHQVIEYPVPSIPLRDRIGLALVNAPDVLAAIAPHASHVLILHGHRHWDWIGTCGDVVLCSGPSVAMQSVGVEGSRGTWRGFHIHELNRGVTGTVQLTATQRVKISASRPSPNHVL